MERKEALTKRWKNLNITSDVLKVAAPQYKDPEVYFEELILKEKNYDLASKRLQILESILIKDEEELLNIELDKIRVKRDLLLLKTDYTQLSDAPINGELKKQYREYRQYLRDLPDLFKFKKKHNDCCNFEDYLTWKEKTKYA